MKATFFCLLSVFFLCESAAQTPPPRPLQPTALEAAGRLTVAEDALAGHGASLVEIRAALGGLRNARAALGARTAANARAIDALSARIEALEAAGAAGCAGLRNPDAGRLHGVQVACIRMLEAATSGTDQSLIATFERIILGTRVRLRTVDEAGDTRTEKTEYVVSDSSDSGVPSLCDGAEVEMVRHVGKTPQSPGSITRLRCTPKVVPYVPTGTLIRRRGAPPVPTTILVRPPKSTATEWLTATLTAGGLGAAAGCGIGGLAQPEQIEDGSFSKSGCGYGTLIGLAGGAALGATVMAIIHASRPDPGAPPLTPVSFGLTPVPGGGFATLGAGF
ncbi:MAG: hypothetical protein HYY51_01205 [Candidatus Magasanikbacteria bacterium]|nr:hypothetical protein [Candidatus Magasanikbacteria bacterium]